ncbi:MAG: hypothetical protein FJW64_05345 [Actinobacteria bacterium]|nr:hypothetical protein [Actinomycetota bacterium]
MSDDGAWTERDDAELIFEGLHDEHPSRIVAAFAGLCLGDALDTLRLTYLVTPESLHQWGDFRAGASFFMDQAISMSTVALRPRGAEDVAYIKIVPDDGSYLSSTPRQDPIAYATLIWRPEIGGWKIHRIGEPVNPAQLPRTADEAPIYANDSHVDAPPLE